MEKETCFIFVTLVLGTITALTTNNSSITTKVITKYTFVNKSTKYPHGQFKEIGSPINGVKNTSHSIHQSQSPYTIEQLYIDSLKLHNYYRQKHNSNPLTLSKSLCQNAYNWALKLAKEEKFEHQTNNKYGENLYYKWSSNPMHRVTAKDAFYSWYSEGKSYDFSREPRNFIAGHFTQIVWKDTQYIGVAMVRSSSGRVYVVAEYYPPGNVIGHFTANVLKPK